MEAGNFVLVLNLIIIAVYANEKGNETDSFADTTRHCDAIEDQEGLCIYLKQCAPLLELLEQAKIEENTNFRALRILQRSTWACSNLDKSKTELKICCPLKFVLRPVNKRFFEEINLPQEGIKGVVKKLHPSFDLLPAIEDCGNVSITDRVVGGSNVELGTYGFIARIGYKVLRNGKIIHGCGGSLINKQYVITAAHCVRGIGSSIKPEEIRLGEFNTNSNPDCSRELGCLPLIDVKIEKIIVHPTYSAHYKWDDIALIRLKTPINYTNVIRPICLPFLEEYDIPDLELYKENSPAIVAGFGKTRWNQAIGSSILQHAEVPIQSHSKCAKLYHDLNYLNVTSKQICAQGQGVFSKGDSCDGDSGGPLIVNKFESKLESKKLFQFQIGIVSYGPRRCGQGVLPGVYTKISEYKEFILESLEPFGSLQK